LVDWTGKEEYEADVRKYFLCCPLCGNGQLTVNLSLSGGRETITCETCGAKWHIYMGLTGLSWAELELNSKDGKGIDLVGKKLKKEEWRQKAQATRRTTSSTSLTIPGPKEKEIISQKEVIVKIRCNYCRNTFSETLDKCPHCGARA
jgi:hypothetical protein